MVDVDSQEPLQKDGIEQGWVHCLYDDELEQAWKTMGRTLFKRHKNTHNYMFDLYSSTHVQHVFCSSLLISIQHLYTLSLHRSALPYHNSSCLLGALRLA